MAAPKFACHSCKKPISAEALHAVVNISPAIGGGDQTFAYFCECVGDLTNHAALREQHKLPASDSETEEA